MQFAAIVIAMIAFVIPKEYEIVVALVSSAILLGAFRELFKAHMQYRLLELLRMAQKN